MNFELFSLPYNVLCWMFIFQPRDLFISRLMDKVNPTVDTSLAGNQSDRMEDAKESWEDWMSDKVSICKTDRANYKLLLCEMLLSHHVSFHTQEPDNLEKTRVQIYKVKFIPGNDKCVLLYHFSIPG